MEVSIYGTKGGFRVLHKTPNAPSIATDIRNNASSELAIGKSVYAVALIESGIVFSKYRIVRDTLRSSATGFIACSLFLSAREKLRGYEVKSILDDLLGFYVNTYVENNKINRGEKSQIIHEDWSFINDILSKYTLKENSAFEVLQPGDEEPAYIYYHTEGELKVYFDKPFQKEYEGFKQILLIDSELKAGSDVLKVIRNSREIKIDLENTYYALKNYNANKRLTLLVNDKPLSEGLKDHFIRLNDKIEIKYGENDRFYHPIHVKGKLSDPSPNKLENYLKIEEDEIYIDYDAFNNPPPKTKTISFIVEDRHGNSVRDASVFCFSHLKPSKKADYNNRIEFTGEELRTNWTVQAEKGESSSETRTIDFEKDCPRENGEIRLKLNEIKKVTFLGDLGHRESEKIKVKIRPKPNRMSDDYPEVVFLNEEIDQTYTVKATYQKRDGGKYVGKKRFSPKDSDSVSIKLNRENNKPIILTSIISLMIISLGAWVFWPSADIDEFGLSQNEIESYVQDVYLAPDKLSDFKAQWDQQNPENKNEESSPWYDLFGWLKNDNDSKDLTQAENWNKVDRLIDRAIDMREYIDQWQFDSLKRWDHYSSNQRRFKELIKGIDSTQYDTIRNNITDVSDLNLNQIADSIINFLRPTRDKIIIEEGQADAGNKESDKNEEAIPEKAQSATSKQNGQNSEADEQKLPEATSNNRSSRIEGELRSDVITQSKLQEYKDNHPRYDNSIKLYIEFWDLVKKSNTQKSEFDRLLHDLKKDKVLGKSELRKFVETICESEAKFANYNKIPGKLGTTTLRELKEKFNESD